MQQLETEAQPYRLRDYLWLEMARWLREEEPSFAGLDSEVAQDLAGELTSVRFCDRLQRPDRDRSKDAMKKRRLALATWPTLGRHLLHNRRDRKRRGYLRTGPAPGRSAESEGTLTRRSQTSCKSASPKHDTRASPSNIDGPERAYRARLPGRLRHPTTIRATLYMAALTAIRHNPAMRLLAKKLQKNGKPSKLANTALIRKLIVTLNAMLRSGEPAACRNCLTAKTVDTLAQAPTPLFRGFPLATHRRSIHWITGGPPQSKIVRSTPLADNLDLTLWANCGRDCYRE